MLLENPKYKSLFGIVYHLLGKDQKAEPLLNAKSELNELTIIIKNGIQNSIDYFSEIGSKHKTSSKENPKNNVRNLYKKVDQIIRDKKYYDEKHLPRRDLRRNPRQLNENEIIERLSAIVHYLLRSYTIFTLNKNISTIDRITLKTAFNDIIQAERLLEDLNFGLHIVNNSGKIVFNPQSSFQNENNLSSSQTTSLNFLMIHLETFLNVMKGNLHRAFFSAEKAMTCYLEGIRANNRLYNGSNTYDNICKYESSFSKTVLKAKFEISKLHFDKGLIIDSILFQLDAILDVFAIDSLEKHNTMQELSIKVLRAKNLITILKKHYRETIISDTVLRIFLTNEPLQQLKDFLELMECKINIPTIEEELPLVKIEDIYAAATNLKHEYKLMLVDILSRIGFNLYTLNAKINCVKLHGNDYNKAVAVYGDDRNKLEEKISELNKDILNAISLYFKGMVNCESELGNYTLALLGNENNKSLPKEFKSRRIERVFAATVIGSFDNVSRGKNKNFYNKLGRLTLVNADNMSSSRSCIAHYLEQKGYISNICVHGAERTSINKFVVLRRWQSFTPKVPRPVGVDSRGGGYFLVWNNKGIVIDPGFDFIRNFYEQGYSINDIDAILITHTHPDHDDEVNSILALIAEYNELQQCNHFWSGDKKVKKPKFIDLFVNEGAYRKYNSWFYSKNLKIRKIFMLQSIRSKRDSKNSRNWNNETEEKNYFIDLKKSYNLQIEVVPAWHDELIDDHSSVGCIFHLYLQHDEQCCVRIGYTGDTEKYPDVEERYKDVDMLIAHVGDIKFSELLLGSEPDTITTSFNYLVESWFHEETYDRCELDAQKKKEIIQFLVQNEIYGLNPDDIRAKIDKISKIKQIEHLFRCKSKYDFKECLKLYVVPNQQYVYRNHLGLQGIISLYRALAENNKKNYQKLFIVGELPEELQSYRHLIACCLDELEPTEVNYALRDGKRKVKCFTGDIGLTIALPTDNYKFGSGSEPAEPFAIRCEFCNKNNEMVKGVQLADGDETRLLCHYHSVDRIQEVCLKGVSSQIVWLCEELHASSPVYARQEFIAMPDMGQGRFR